MYEISAKHPVQATDSHAVNAWLGLFNARRDGRQLLGVHDLKVVEGTADIDEIESRLPIEILEFFFFF